MPEHERKERKKQRMIEELARARKERELRRNTAINELSRPVDAEDEARRYFRTARDCANALHGAANYLRGAFSQTARSSPARIRFSPLPDRVYTYRKEATPSSSGSPSGSSDGGEQHAHEKGDEKEDTDSEASGGEDQNARHVKEESYDLSSALDDVLQSSEDEEEKEENGGDEGSKARASASEESDEGIDYVPFVKPDTIEELLGARDIEQLHEQRRRVQEEHRSPKKHEERVRA